MPQRPKTVFVAMPFRPELNFVYLYLERFLHDEFGITVKRGDAQVLDKPLMEKIRDQILRADLIIGDVTGNNPNVFYELGLAHARGKSVIFITQDPPEQAPVDIRAFEFIHYDLGQHVAFLERLKNAIQSYFSETYQELYDEAIDLLQNFNGTKGLNCQATPLEDFQAKVMRTEQTGGGIPSLDDQVLRVGFLLPKVISDFTEPSVFANYNSWINESFD
jgi:nucleoside 2-deoxyribosyltransferase